MTKRQKIDLYTITVVGKARYKGLPYYIRWYGQTKTEKYMARLASLDGKLDFWVHCARPGQPGRFDLADIYKRYQKHGTADGRQAYPTLGEIAAWIEQRERDKLKQESMKGQCPDCGSMGCKGAVCEACKEAVVV